MGDPRNKINYLDRQDRILENAQRQAMVGRVKGRLLPRCGCGKTWHDGVLYSLPTKWGDAPIFACEACLPESAR